MTDFDKVHDFVASYIDTHGYKPSAKITSDATGLGYERVEYLYLRLSKRPIVKIDMFRPNDREEMPYCLIDPRERVRL
jgi:hypothetical protein